MVATGKLFMDDHVPRIMVSLSWAIGTFISWPTIMVRGIHLSRRRKPRRKVVVGEKDEEKGISRRPKAWRKRNPLFFHY